MTSEGIVVFDKPEEASMLLVVALKEGQNPRAWGTKQSLTGPGLNWQGWTLGKICLP